MSFRIGKRNTTGNVAPANIGHGDKYAWRMCEICVNLPTRCACATPWDTGATCLCRLVWGGGGERDPLLGCGVVHRHKAPVHACKVFMEPTYAAPILHQATSTTLGR